MPAPRPQGRASFLSRRSQSPVSSDTGTPAEPVTAESLQALLQLADAGPPLYRPIPPKARLSLVLWIVRVPDSRDLILTTLAPPRHSPSARAIDIESSLYFLHLHATEPEVPRATLIRRDPASGAQTNIAHILPTGETVQLELLGPGYRKFLELPLPPRPQDSDTDDVLNEWQTRRMDYHRRTSPVPSMLGADLATVNTSHFFTREMRIEGANLWERMKGFRRHQKNSSVLDVPSRERTKKTRDFVFEPPWAIGRCEFKDEAGGKFLKCKHYIPDEEKSTLLSVIEFKPPSLAHRRTLSDSGGGREKYGKIKAKMGMLVVHSPGQEFLDLLVTANMVAFLQRWDTWGIEQDRWQE